MFVFHSVQQQYQLIKHRKAQATSIPGEYMYSAGLQRVAVKPAAAAGGRELRGRTGPHDGGRQPADPPAALRAGGAGGRSEDGAGRGRG